MSRIIRCDRCGCDIKKHEKVGYLSWVWRDIEHDDVLEGNPFTDYDFCESCMDSIKNCVTGYRDIKIELDDKPFSSNSPVFLSELDSEDLSDELEEESAPEEPKKEPEEEIDPVLEALAEKICNAKASEAEKVSAGKKSVDLKKFREMMLEGKTPGEIADALGFSLSSYGYYRARAKKAFKNGEI